MIIKKPLQPPLNCLARTLRRYYAPLGALGAFGAVCLAAGMVMQDAEAFPASIELSSLDGITGFTLFGNAPDRAGRAVDDIGDINADGIADIVVGGASSRSWVVFGRTDSDFPDELELSALDGNNGFMLQGGRDYLAGSAVAGAGDVNDDGIGDLIIGAPQADPNGASSGQSYVVFGRSQPFAATLVLSTLDGTNGFAMNGVNANDLTGYSVSGVGDINGDRIDDVIVGAHNADPNGTSSGKSYVVFGRSHRFTTELELSTLDGNNGFIIHGAIAFSQSGFSVSGAGDINGDGLSDLVIGAPTADVNSLQTYTGQSYVVFGRSGGFTATLELSALNGNDGFAINGVNFVDASGYAVSGAGDVNGDDLDDLIIGAVYINPNEARSGESYIVFGRSSGFAATLELSALDGNNGFTLPGVNPGDRSGGAVSGAGDINGDEIDDLVIGASRADPNGSRSGQSYVVLGRSSGFSATLELSTLSGGDGFTINGTATYDYSGRSVSSAGDVNDDGLDDLIIGVPLANANGAYSGRSYVVLGRTDGFATTLELSAFSGDDGFIINGIHSDDRAGRAVSGVGDINDDGFDDLLIGAYRADPNGDDSGQSYLVFGRSETFVPEIELSALTDSDGFTLNGVNIGSQSGFSVSGAGDINGDAIDDLIIGTRYAVSGVSGVGQSYVVFGHSGVFTETLELSALDGNNGFTLIGSNPLDDAGRAVSNAGDINGDGLADLIIGAYRADAGDFDSGQSYVVFGRTTGFAATLNLSTLDGNNGFTLDGIGTNDQSGLSVSGAGDFNGDNVDDLIIAAPDANPNGTRSGESYLIFGHSNGFDTSLDLATLDGNNGFTIHGINAFDRAGYSVSGAGDVNGDGFDDVIIGTYHYNDFGLRVGQSYLIYGRSSGLGATLELSALDGNNGFTINGVNQGDDAGRTISGMGDINGDGLDDFIISALYANPNGTNSGQNYVIFGNNNGFAATFELDSLDGANGFTLNGAKTRDRAGRSVSGAGDINGDGINDLVIGAPSFDTSKSHVIFGTQADLAVSITDSLDPVDLNTNLDYIITVSNQGPTYTTDVRVEFTFTPPDALSIISFPQSWECSGLGPITCTLPDNLLTNTSEILTLSFTTTNQATQVTVEATVTSSDFDPQTNNNSATETTTIDSLLNEIFDDQFE